MPSIWYLDTCSAAHLPKSYLLFLPFQTSPFSRSLYPSTAFAPLVSEAKALLRWSWFSCCSYSAHLQCLISLQLWSLTIFPPHIIHTVFLALYPIHIYTQWPYLLMKWSQNQAGYHGSCFYLSPCSLAFASSASKKGILGKEKKKKKYPDPKVKYLWKYVVTLDKMSSFLLQRPSQKQQKCWAWNAHTKYVPSLKCHIWLRFDKVCTAADALQLQVSHGWPLPWLWLKDFPQAHGLCVLPPLCGSAELFCCVPVSALDVFVFAAQALPSFCSVLKFCVPRSTKKICG